MWVAIGVQKSVYELLAGKTDCMGLYWELYFSPSMFFSQAATGVVYGYRVRLKLVKISGPIPLIRVFFSALVG